MKRLWLWLPPLLLVFSGCPGDTPFDTLEAAAILTDTDRAFTGWSVTYSITTSFDFLDFTDAGSVSYTTTGLDDTSSAVYRLDLVNLMSDGGFEAGSTLGNPVDGGGAGATEGSIAAGVSPYDIDGNVYYFNLPDPEDRIDFDLNTYLSEYSAEGMYVLRFDLKSLVSTVAFEQWPGESGAYELWSLTIDEIDGTLYHVPEAFTSYVDSSFTYDASGTFTIGRNINSSPVQSGYIDNLRVSRVNTGAALTFEVPFSDATGSRPDLLSGYYRFSIKILNDPEVTPEVSGPNRMAATSVTLSMESLDGVLTSELYHQAWEADSTAGWTGWTEVYLETESIQIDEPEDTSQTVLALSIVPTNAVSGCRGYDAGSILIAEPSLEYSSDGTFD